MNTNRVLISCLVIILVACLCLSFLAVAGGALFLINGRTVTSSNPTAISTTTVEKTPAPTIPAAGGQNLPADVTAQMDTIEQEVAGLRELPASGHVSRAVLTPDQLRERVVSDFLQDYTPEEAELDVIALAAFGLVEPGIDLISLYEELLTEQIAGFYDDETKEMFVIQGETFTGVERMTYAHEYVHALQDMNFGIRESLQYDDDLCEEDSERCAALQALLEGDASLAEQFWLYDHASEQDLSDIMDFFNQYTSPIFDSAPAFLQQDFLFPYLNGMSFVESLYEQGGWQAVDQAYSEPPQSTEQILHPERYPSDRPLKIELPDLSTVLGSGWEQIDAGALGEWYSYLVLAHGSNPQARLVDSAARKAAEGWGGDAYQVLYNQTSGQSVLVLKSTWDSPRDASEFASALQEYAQKRFKDTPSRQSGRWVWETSQAYSLLSLEGSTTLWIIAPDQTFAKNLTSAVIP